MYLTTDEVDRALNLGYEVIQSPHNGPRFKKNTRRIWRTDRGWMTADLLPANALAEYTNHLFFENLDDALNRPIGD